MSKITKDVELLEWPSDTSRLSCDRERRFMSETDYNNYIDYHMKPEHEDDKLFRQKYSSLDDWSVLLYKRGYAVPSDWLNIVDESTSATLSLSDDEPKSRGEILDKYYSSRKKCLRERWRRRQVINRELRRWNVQFDRSRALKMPNRMIVDISRCRDKECMERGIVRWLCRLTHVYEVFMYKGLKSNVGFNYYCDELVIVIFIEERDKEIDRKQLYKIRKLLRKDTVKYRGNEYSLHDKWIVVLDKTGQVTCEAYGLVHVGETMKHTEVTKLLNEYNPHRVSDESN